MVPSLINLPAGGIMRFLAVVAAIASVVVGSFSVSTTAGANPAPKAAVVGAMASAHQTSKTAVKKCKSCLTATASHYVSKAAAEKYAKKSHIGGLCGKGAGWQCTTQSIQIRCLRHDGFHSWLCNVKWTDQSFTVPPVIPASGWQKCAGQVDVYHTTSVNNLSVKCA
jgi:hypothetical protein